MSLPSAAPVSCTAPDQARRRTLPSTLGPSLGRLRRASLPQLWQPDMASMGHMAVWRARVAWC